MSQNMQLGFESSTTFLHILNNILDETDSILFIVVGYIYCTYTLYTFRIGSDFHCLQPSAVKMWCAGPRARGSVAFRRAFKVLHYFDLI